jgi:gamma-glutamyl-gamma-aminobutyrate hydrolase PuuD
MKNAAIITMRSSVNDYGEVIESVSRGLIELIKDLDFRVILVPNEEYDIQNLFNTFKPKLLVLSGGEDIGQNKARDIREFEMLEVAIEHDIKVVGICRGMQVMLKYCGIDAVPLPNHAGTKHFINGHLNYQVNSYHKNGFFEITDEFEITGKAPDESIEEIRHKVFPWLGFMWHPERELLKSKSRSAFLNKLKTI